MRKPKITKAKMAQFEIDWHKHNKWCKQNHLHDFKFAKLSDYIDYRYGMYKSPERTVVRERTLEWQPYVRETKNYPSLSDKKTPNLGNGATIDHKQRQERLEVSKGYTIVPAYNKGPYMVISKDEIKTAGRKV